jgi:hypothetical protein
MFIRGEQKVAALHFFTETSLILLVTLVSVSPGGAYGRKIKSRCLIKEAFHALFN